MNIVYINLFSRKYYGITIFTSLESKILYFIIAPLIFNRH